MNPRIIPLNLPAELDREIPGNPVTSRLESAIGNCYPGLEIDVRNLDRRFFPGLVFEFVADIGAQLVAVDLNDPDIPADRQDLTNDLTSLSTTLAKERVYLEAVKVEGGQRIALSDDNGAPYGWAVTWRIVRSIDYKPVTIELSTRDGSKSKTIMTLKAQRRQYQNEEGAFSRAYQPGELSQALCSPWQHDFRDCACTYWASNHPDIVLPAHPASIAETKDPGELAQRAEDPLIWLRFDTSSHVGPRPTEEACSPFEMDHYEINDRWRDLSFVLGGREHPTPWSIGEESSAPLDAEKLSEELVRLAGIEHALAIEYLYARYSVRFEDPELSAEDQSHADFIAHELLVVAISEMMHLRWVNQMIWDLNNAGLTNLEPALGVAQEVPREDRKPGGPLSVRMRAPLMRTIDDAIYDFIAAESPSGTIESQYAELRELFRRGSGYPADMVGLVERIIADGVTHYSRFREIKALLEFRHDAPLVRREMKILTRENGAVNVTIDGKPAKISYADFVDLYRKVIDNLRDGYASGRVEDRAFVIAARQAMIELDNKATALARRNWAVPLLDVAREATSGAR